MNKKRILLIFGGESSEHEVSISSAKNVYGAIDRSKYDVELCYITKDGKEWRHVSAIDDFEGPILRPLLGSGSFLSSNGEVAIDVILPVLHGKHGEDGEVQGLANLLHIPCVGPSLIGAAITMDKDTTKRLLDSAGVPVVKWETWQVGDPRPSYDHLADSLSSVMFVKPANAGSSVGVSKVTDRQTLENALNLASEHDTMVLIEQAIDAREIELAVLGGVSPRVSGPGEIIPGEDFYSYEDKYAEGSASVARIPADLTVDVAGQLRDLALKAYAATRGQGMARVDFFVTPNDEIYCNEINSIPGFTDISMYPKLWEHEGMTQTELIDQLIEAALE